MLRIGLISDTHGLLRPEAKAFLRGCDHILHAGDVDDPETLEQIQLIAPTTTVRGNCDRDAWSWKLPLWADVRMEGVAIHMLHDLGKLALDPAGSGVRVVVSGHSHRPLAEERDGVLYVNPGSAGPRRFSLPVSVGELRVDGDRVVATLVDLKIPAAAPLAD